MGVIFQISDNYKLCIAAQTAQSSLPSGAIHMAAVTPLAGLFKWCILSPLYSIEEVEKIEGDKELYNKLHFALLESLREAGPATGPSSILSVQHLLTVIPAIKNKISDLMKTGIAVNNEPLLQVTKYLFRYCRW